MRIPITIYPSHIRLSKKDIKKLFAENYKLKKQITLPQENTFFCQETITLQNHKFELNHVPIIGPTTKETQVFLTTEDSQKIHLQTITALPFQKKWAQNITIKNWNNFLYTRENTITSPCYLQISTSEAKEHNLKQNQKIDIQFNKSQTILKNITTKIKDSYILDLFLPKDIAEQKNIQKSDRAQIIKF